MDLKTTTSLEEFKSCLPLQGRLFGIDYGKKRIGLALSDERRMIASPLETVIMSGKTDATRKAITAIGDLAMQHEIVGAVIGLPLNMDYSHSPGAQAVESFARKLQALVALPVLLWDERWSTNAVNRVMLDADLSRKRREKLVDKLAAVYILQGVLDAQ